MLVYKATAIEERNEENFAHGLLLPDFFRPRFLWTFPCFALAFRVQIKVMNPTFIDRDYFRENRRISPMSTRFSRHTFTCCCICLVIKKCGIQVEAMRRMPICSIKIWWIVDFGIFNCRPSRFTDACLSSWITVATVLMLTSVITDFFVPPRGPNPTISQLSQYDLCHKFTVGLLKDLLSYAFFILA